MSEWGILNVKIIMPRLKTDLLKIINYTLKNRLNRLKLKWEKNKCMTIVLCSKDTLETIEKGK